MSFFETLVAIKDLCEFDEKSLFILIICLFRVGNANGTMSAKTRESLMDACNLFQVSFDKCYQVYLNNHAYEQTEKKAYEILGCTASDSDQTIKERYRILVKDFHPDRIRSKELAADFTDFAEEKFKQIQAAYEYVQEKRKDSAN